MPSFQRRASNSSPSPIAWLSAAASVLLILGTCAALELTASGIGRALAVQEFVQSLRTPRIGATSDEIVEFFRSRLTPFGALAKRVRDWMNDELEIDGSSSSVALVDSLRTLLKQVQDQSFEAARGTLSTVLKYQRVTLLNALGANEAARNRVRDIEEVLERCEKLRIAIPQTAQSLEDARVRASGDVIEFKGAADDLAELLGLRAEELPEQGQNLPVYALGVLAGLPRLQNLPDDLPDLATLNEIMTSLGGKIGVSGSNLAEAFNQRIIEIRAVVTSSNASYSTSLQEVDQFSQRLSAERTEYTLAQRRATQAIIATIKAVVQPEISALSQRFGQPLF